MENRAAAEYFVVRRGATALPNRTAHSLNIAALGLLVKMLALPPGAPMGYRAFVGWGLGEKALRTAIRELEDAGFRWRYRVRRDGLVRTATVVFDEPVIEEEARTAITGMANGRVEACLSVSETRRAATGAARWDSQDFNGRTVPHSTVARSTEARSGAAQLLRSSKDSSLRSESLPSIQGDEFVDVSGDAGSDERIEPMARPGDLPVQGADLPPMAASSYLPVRDADRAVVAASLPQSMQPLPDTGTAAVASRLHVLIRGGWTADDIRAVLASQALPPEVRSMTHLVLYRLKDIDPAGSAASRHQRRGEDRELLRQCLPSWLWPPTGSGIAELGEYVREEVVAGVEPREIEESIALAFPREGGVPSAKSLLCALQGGSAAVLSGVDR